MQQTISVVLNDNTAFTLEIENYDSNALTSLLNNQQMTVVNIGGLIVNRNTVKVIVPVSTTPAT